MGLGPLYLKVFTPFLFLKVFDLYTNPMLTYGSTSLITSSSRGWFSNSRNYSTSIPNVNIGLVLKTLFTCFSYIFHTFLILFDSFQESIRIRKSVKHDFSSIPDHLSGQDLLKIVKNHVLCVYTRQNVHFLLKNAHFCHF